MTGNEEVRFLFDSEDMFESMIAIRSPNLKPGYEDRIIGQIKLNLATPSNFELTKRFSELNPNVLHFGIDDKNNSWGNKVCFARHEEVDAMYSSGACSILDARRFLRRGSPPALRSQLWRTALSLPDECSTQERNAFNKLRLDCDAVDLLTDALFMHDVHTITDDPRFFVFEVLLCYVVLLCRCRCAVLCRCVLVIRHSKSIIFELLSLYFAGRAEAGGSMFLSRRVHTI